MTMIDRFSGHDTLADDLRRLAQHDARAERFRLTLRAQIQRQAETQHVVPGNVPVFRKPARRPLPSLPGTWRTRLASAGTMAALVVGGTLGYFHLQAPTPVSAAQIISRTTSALTTVADGTVVHESATIHTSAIDGLRVHVDALGLAEPNGQIVRDARVDEWTEFSPDGSIERQDVTVTDIPSGALLSHEVMTASDTFRYDAAINGTTITPGGAATWRRVLGSDQPVTILNLESGGQGGLLQLLNESRQSGAARSLGQQTIGGVALDVIQITHPLHVYASPGSDLGPLPDHVTYTVYIDAQNYLIDHVTAQAVGPDGRVLTTTTLQVTRHATLPATSAPAGTFSFSSPPGACVLTVNPDQPSQSQPGTVPCLGARRP